MRFDGNLSKWNDDRGFGFIKPRDGGQEVFVHISAFPRDGQRPRLDEALSFEIEPGADGRKRAVGIRRPHSARPGPSRRRNATSPRPARRVRGALLAVVLACGLGALGYNEYARRSLAQSSTESAGATPGPRTTLLRSAAPAFRCDGRTHCSQMTSCREAKFFLANCPGVKMDGDNDGVPCEQQLCTGPFAQ
jgi:cold shock CspA family protein